jgi:hypothetical protein
MRVLVAPAARQGGARIMLGLATRRAPRNATELVLMPPFLIGRQHANPVS